MKYLFLFLLISTAVVAQDRIQQEGNILSVTKEPLEGITIFNGSTLEGTVTNEDGNFYIDVRAGDKLSFSAVQYDPFTVMFTSKEPNGNANSSRPQNWLFCHPSTSL